MSHQRRGLILLLPTLIAILAGCGSDPGGDFVIGDIDQAQLPISGASQKIADAFGLLRAGSATQSRELFNKVLTDSPSTSDRALAWAGVGFADVRLKGSQDGINEFETALGIDSSSPEARVGLAGALISRGANLDVLRSIELLQGLGPNNPEFIYQDRFGLGISNAEVHALLAYALFVSGDQAGSNTQANIARRLDANFANTNVGNILDVISFIP